jgi:hypothetical protein
VASHAGYPAPTLGKLTGESGLAKARNSTEAPALPHGSSLFHRGAGLRGLVDAPLNRWRGRASFGQCAEHSAKSSFMPSGGTDQSSPELP